MKYTWLNCFGFKTTCVPCTHYYDRHNTKLRPFSFVRLSSGMVGEFSSSTPQIVRLCKMRFLREILRTSSLSLELRHENLCTEKIIRCKFCTGIIGIQFFTTPSILISFLIFWPVPSFIFWGTDLQTFKNGTSFA